MKWLSNPNTKPNIGDTRYVMKFAWLPIIAWSIKDNLRYKVWLSYYKQKQVYKHHPVNQGYYSNWEMIQNMIA